jgi:hypothetical protein
VRYYPDDSGGETMGYLDPLDRARVHLDYEAMNQAAPSVKEVLFRAQMLGPVEPVREAWRPRPATLALAFLVLLVLVPWIPQRASFTVMHVGFEQELPRADADRLAAHLLRNQPDNVLIGTEFTPTQAHRMGYNVPGRLRVTLTAFNVAEQELEERYRKEISTYQGIGLDPMFRVEQHTEEKGFRNPVQLAMAAMQPLRQPRLQSPSEALQVAQLVQANDHLLAGALQPKVTSVNSELKVRDVSFGPAKAGYDFTLPAWPKPASFKVTGYGGLPAAEQLKVREEAAALLAQANLGQPAAPPDEPVGPLIAVRVSDAQGLYDPILTAKVQAWITQPQPHELGVSFDPSLAVRRAVEKAVPGTGYSSTYETLSSPTVRFIVDITLQDKRRMPFGQTPPDADAAAEAAGDDDANF